MLYLVHVRTAVWVVQIAPVAYLLWAAVGYLPGNPWRALAVALVADIALYAFAAVCGLVMVFGYVRW